MDSEEEEMLLLMLLYRRRKRKRRSVWVHDIFKKREELGEFHRLVRELSSHEDKFFEYFRMSQTQFAHILQLVEGDLKKEITHYRKPISPKERLAICLRFLASGDSYKSLSFSYRVGKSTIVGIVPEVCDALWKRLQPLYMTAPREEDWSQIAEGFLKRWQFPNCIGAIDGKHVLIQAPDNSGSVYFNYKRSFSVVLMALVDHRYRFIVVDIGAYGSQSDGGIFARSTLGKVVENNELQLPADKVLPGSPDLGLLPHVIVGDEAFPMKRNLMRPYPGRDLDDQKRIFNYRLSRARRVVENAFGLLAARFRIYQRRIQLQPDNLDRVVEATCVLHNYLLMTSPTPVSSDSVQEQEWPNSVTTCPAALGNLQMTGNRATKDAVAVRATFRDYFNSPTGAVEWQRDKCFGQAK